MQIPPTSSAAQAASILSQATAKDRASSGASTAPASSQAATEMQVEQSGTANPDRDAQGQGDGLGNRPRSQITDENDVAAEATSNDTPPAVDFGEPPSQLDIVG